MHQALQKNAQKLLTRRQNDVKDEVDEIAGKPNTGLVILCAFIRTLKQLRKIKQNN